jgi:hypothetical protein
MVTRSSGSLTDATGTCENASGQAAANPTTRDHSGERSQALARRPVQGLWFSHSLQMTWPPLQSSGSILPAAAHKALMP